MSTPLSKRRQRRERRERGECALCGNPSLSYYCGPCKTRYAESHRMAVDTYRDRRRALGKCIQCGHEVTHLSPRTGLPSVRCAPCSRLQADVQRRWREGQKLAALGVV